MVVSSSSGTTRKNRGAVGLRAVQPCEAHAACDDLEREVAEAADGGETLEDALRAMMKCICLHKGWEAGRTRLAARPLHAVWHVETASRLRALAGLVRAPRSLSAACSLRLSISLGGRPWALVEFFASDGAKASDADLAEVGRACASLAPLLRCKRLASNVAESERDQRVLFFESPDALLLVDPEDGVVVDANRSAGELFGRPCLGLLNDTLESLTGLAPPERQPLDAPSRAAMGTVIISGGHGLPVDVALRSVDLHGLSLLLVSLRDASRLRLAEQRGDALATRASELLRLSPAPCFVLEKASLRILEVNDAAVRHSGYERESLLGRAMTELSLPAEAADFGAWLRTEPADPASLRLWRQRRSEGRWQEMELRVHPTEHAGAAALAVVSRAVHEHAQASTGAAPVTTAEVAMRARAVDRLHLEDDLRAALQGGQLQVNFQPIVTLDNGRIAGFEALVRWPHPKYGDIPPADFIPLAEETRLIVPLGAWVLHTACRSLAALQQRGAPALKMSVNFSVQQLRSGEVIAEVECALHESGLAPESLQVEVTESMMIDQKGDVLDVLRRLQGLGVRIAMDDFGTGYSSLSHLIRLPIDVLKIDHSFIDAMGSDPKTAQIVQTIIMLGRNLGIELVAEGVETVEQASLLRTMGCDCAQGYLYAKAMSEADTRKLLAWPTWRQGQSG